MARPSRLALAAGALGLLAACSSGESLLNAGNEPTTTVATTTTTTTPTVAATSPVTAPVTDAPGETRAPTTSARPSTTMATTTTTTTPPTTTTTPLAALPPCPVDALEDESGPVEVVFWHGFAADIEDALVALTDEYNASQTRVHVTLQNQGGYNQTIDKYAQSSQDARPNLVSMPEYMLQQLVDSESIVPAGACLEASDFDTSEFLPRVLLAYDTGGVQWSMPFNVSNPVLFYNKRTFAAAGLDPERPPGTISELRDAAQAISDAGLGIGIAFDSGVDSGGGWFLEQWSAQAGELYADNGNGRLAPATQVLFDGPTNVELLTEVQSMITDGLAVSVGANPGGQDTLLRMAAPVDAAAMALNSSAALGTAISVLDGGLIPGVTSAELGMGPLPGPGDTRLATVGGAALYIVAEKGDAATAATWDYITYLVSAQTQSTWAAATGYVPVREDAVTLEPLAAKYAQDPRYQVAYDQVKAGTDDLAAVGPVLGPMRQVRTVTANAVAAIFAGADVQASLTDAAQQADTLITQYAIDNG